MKVIGERTAAPVFSAMVIHDQPVSSIRPIAQRLSSASVAPRALNHGISAELNKLPITPPAAKFCISSTFRDARAQDERMSVSPPMIRIESEKKST